MSKKFLDIKNVGNFISKKEILYFEKEVKNHILNLEKCKGLGSEFTAWNNLPNLFSKKELKDIQKTSNFLSSNSEIVVVIGIGGSYLGAKAVINALSDNFNYLKNKKKNPLILFAGQNLSEDYLFELLGILKEKSFSVVVISKSGTTTEPAIAFRILKKLLEEKYGKNDLKNRIVVITDEKKGALKILSDKENYKKFIIPDDIGGRYSVLTAVGLLPIAIAGFDIEKLLLGAKNMCNLTKSDINFEKNPAAIYAVIRNILYKKGKKIEILVNYNPKLNFLSEWWKQLFGESEGKEKKGIFPANANFTTDLHSLGQYIQDGERTIFETVISVEETKHKLKIPFDIYNIDKLNYLYEKNIDEINKKAEEGTTKAHLDGGVPNIKISIDKIDEYSIGEIIYFFEKSCAISAYILGINPFNQEGVEEYKKNMFKLLGKK
ncbi:MAG: glucose-6-phosphate isomerase [Bacteroidetes bacterium 4572_128]|nr:MAG: glucose-6-phosphate isomerase [Bacteroidetes bacterium 4572_128]